MKHKIAFKQKFNAPQETSQCGSISNSSFSINFIVQISPDSMQEVNAKPYLGWR